MFEKVKADPKYLELIRMREEANTEFVNAIATAEERGAKKERAKAEKREQELRAETEKRERELRAETEKREQELRAKAEAEKRELARNLLIAGVSAEVVAKSLNLSLEEIKEIKKKVQ